MPAAQVRTPRISNAAHIWLMVDWRTLAPPLSTRPMVVGERPAASANCAIVRFKPHRAALILCPAFPIGGIYHRKCTKSTRCGDLAMKRRYILAETTRGIGIWLTHIGLRSRTTPELNSTIRWDVAARRTRIARRLGGRTLHNRERTRRRAITGLSRHRGGSVSRQSDEHYVAGSVGRAALYRLRPDALKLPPAAAQGLQHLEQRRGFRGD